MLSLQVNFWAMVGLVIVLSTVLSKQMFVCYFKFTGRLTMSDWLLRFLCPQWIIRKIAELRAKMTL